MGFWIYMLVVSMILPFTMIGLGGAFSKKAPKEINGVFGYRTTMSMKNRDTWEFAHHYCGRLWKLLGWPSLVVALIVMLIAKGSSTDSVGLIGGGVCILQLILLIGCVFPTEAALKKNFNKDGSRR